MKSYVIKMVIDGVEKKLGEENDFMKRRVFPTFQEAENEAAFWRSIHRNAKVTVVQVETDD